MKLIKLLSFSLLAGLLIVACQDDAMSEMEQHSSAFTFEFEVPEIPQEMAAMMSAEDIARFEAGPGAEYLAMTETPEARRGHRGRWHPVLMQLGYHLQFGPFVGESCESPIPCFGPTGPTGAPGCEDPANYLGVMGKTVADGFWFSKTAHSEYFPVFCWPDYAGYGAGFYLVNGDVLWLEAENGPFNVDEETGDMTFCRIGHYVGDQSSGKFSGARGWEVMLSYTAVENNPGNPANGGQGYSDVIIFGWVYY